MSKKLRAKTEDELQVLFTCPVIRQQRLQLCKSEFDNLGDISNQLGVLGTSDAGDHLEQHVQFTSKPGIFGKGSKLASQRSCAQAILRSLVSSSNKLAGFSQLAQHRTHNTSSESGLAGFSSPLVVLLRRVSMWYYYHVMYSPAEVLLYATSGCELLFQLLSPHQQLAIMSEIVTMLSSPSMTLSTSDSKNGELLPALDTPVHTATFMSMLYMAKQLAVAEAAEHQQQQQGQGHDAPPKAHSPFTALHPTALLQLRLTRLQRCADDMSPLQEQQQQQQQQQSVPPSGCPALVTAVCANLYGVLQFELFSRQLHDVSHVVLQQPQHSLACEASVQQQEALGPLLSQVSKLSTSQLHLWQYIQQYAGDAELGESSGLEEQSAATGIRAAAVTAAALQQLKQSFEAAGVLQNWDGCSPLCVMLLKVLQQQQCPSQQPDMQQQQRQQHVEALAMLHVVSVLLHGVIYEHALDISRINLQPYLANCQLQLLLSIRSRITALLLSAQQRLKAAALNLALGSSNIAANSSESSQGNSIHSSEDAAAAAVVWRSIMQQVQAAVLQLICARQVMKPQVVYLALDNELKDVLRRSKPDAQQDPDRTQTRYFPQQQQRQQQGSAVGSSSGKAAASSNTDSTGPMFLSLFQVLQYWLLEVVVQETAEQDQAPQYFVSIASDLNISLEDLAARMPACIDRIMQSSTDLVQQTYLSVYQLVSNSGLLQFREQLREMLVHLQPYMVQNASNPDQQDIAKVAKLFCCVFMLVELQEVCNVQHETQQSAATQLMLHALNICGPIMPTLVSAYACLQRQPSWRMLDDKQLQSFDVSTYWMNEQFSMSPRRTRAWVKLSVQLDISENFKHRLKSLIRRLQQQEAFEQDPSKSSNNRPCDSEETDDADEDEPTFPEMATALDKVFVNWQYEDTELQQEGLELLQRAYEHVLEVISETESGDDLRGELQREVAGPLIDLVKKVHPVDYNDIHSRFQCFVVDELPPLVKEWSTQLVKIAGTLTPKRHSHGTTPTITELLQAWEDYNEVHAERWLDKAGSFLQGLRLMVRLYMRCSMELPRLKKNNGLLSKLLEALPEYPLTPAAAASEELPDDDVLYTLCMKIRKQQQSVKVCADTLTASQHCLDVAFGKDVGRCAWLVMHKMLSLVVHAGPKGGAWCKVSRDASDKMTAVVTLMLSYLHSTTADLGLPGDFKLQDFQLAAATLSADTVQALLNSFEVRGGMQAFYWMFQQLPASTVNEVARRASGRAMVPEFASWRRLGQGTYVYNSRASSYSDLGISWDGYERCDELGFSWTELPTLGQLGSKQAPMDLVHRALKEVTALSKLQENQADLAAAVAAGSASSAELAQLHQEVQRKAAAVAAQCHETLLHVPEYADADPGTESHSSADSERCPVHCGGPEHSAGSRTAVGRQGSKGSSNMVQDITAASRFAGLQREHAVAQRLLNLQQQLAVVDLNQQEMQLKHEPRTGATAAAQPQQQQQQQQMAWLHISSRHSVLLPQQVHSCCLDLMNNDEAHMHQQCYGQGIVQLQRLHDSIKAAHTGMQNQLASREAVLAAPAAASVSLDTSQLKMPCSGSCSKHGSSDVDPEMLHLGAKCACTAAAALDPGSSNTFRTLLWQVLVELKPSVQPWYHQLIAKHNQQQHGSLSSTCTPASVPDQAIPELWDLVGSSIAADILVVPPAFRDLLQNGWAGGAGRLTHSSSSSGGGGSGVTATAARMLVVQYARAARKKAVKAYDPQQLMMQLMMLQLLATDDDKLAELQPAAAAPVAAALTTATHAAEVGAHPLLAAVVEAQAATSSSSSSSSSDSGVNIYQLAAQYGVFAAPPLLALPWLQFLNSYHALHSAMATDGDLLRSSCIKRYAARVARGVPDQTGRDYGDDLGDQGPGFSPMHEPETSLAAAAAVMMSYPCTDYPRLLLWLKKGMERFDEDKVPAVPTSWLPAAVQIPQPQQQQQQQQSSGYGDNHVNQPLLSMSHWLHADRLMSVPPSSWQQYLYSSTGSSSTGSSSKDMQQQHELLADLCCDWCGERISPAAAASGVSSGDVSGWCCAGCGCTQYCSAGCAAAARKLHSNNCWRIAALAADGQCWQQQQRPGDKQSRAFFDYCIVEASQGPA